MNVYEIIITAALSALAVAAVVAMIVRKRRGKGCSCNCSGCAFQCDRKKNR